MSKQIIKNPSNCLFSLSPSVSGKQNQFDMLHLKDFEISERASKNHKKIIADADVSKYLSVMNDLLHECSRSKKAISNRDSPSNHSVNIGFIKLNINI